MAILIVFLVDRVEVSSSYDFCSLKPPSVMFQHPARLWFPVFSLYSASETQISHTYTVQHQYRQWLICAERYAHCRGWHVIIRLCSLSSVSLSRHAEHGCDQRQQLAADVHGRNRQLSNNSDAWDFARSVQYHQHHTENQRYHTTGINMPNLTFTHLKSKYRIVLSGNA